MRPALRLMLATAAYAGLHSALASRSAKRLVASAFGESFSRIFYRPFFVAQAILSTTALLVYARGVPARTLFHVQGPAGWLLRTGQAAALVHAYAAAHEAGLARISGLEGLVAWVRGKEIPLEPVAQGPEREPVSGTLTTAGPFRWSRHPLNFSAVPLFWLAPHLTTRRLAFNVVATVYLVLGSLHEEHRLREAYGKQYLAYQRSGVPFFLPPLRAW